MRGLLLASCLVVCVCVLGVAGASAEVESEAEWPTLLESTSQALTAGRFAPVGRTLDERMELAQTSHIPQYLGAKTQQLLFMGSDARGHAQDTAGNQRENWSRAREPLSNHFGASNGAGLNMGVALGAAAPSTLPPVPRAQRPCGKPPCVNDGPVTPPPVLVLDPIPPPKIPTVDPPRDFDDAPPPENPPPSPPKPTCRGLCDPQARDPLLARVPAPPLNEAAIAWIDREDKNMVNIDRKIANRDGWLRAQKTWLTKAVEAAATIRREIELAKSTRDAVVSELEQLTLAQERLSVRYKANKLKWAFKDKKMTMEKLHEELDRLQHAREDIAHQMRQAKDEVAILQSTLGSPSQQVQISPAELEDPLKFLQDVQAEEDQLQI